MKKFLNVLVILSLFLVSCKMDYDVLKRESNIESISVDTSAAKKSSYVVSESFDPTGLKVIAHYTDGTTQEVDLAQVTFENFSSEKANEALPVTAKYQEFTTTFNVCVKENEIVRLEVIQRPMKLHYSTSEGISQDNLDLNGLKVAGIDNLGKRTILEEKEYSVLDFSINNVNSEMNLLTIVYNKNQDVKTTLPVYFDNWSVNEVTITGPNKTKFFVGTEKPDYSGLIVTADSHSSINESQYSIIPSDISGLEVGSHEIYVWVNNKKASFTIEIVDEYLAGITIDEIYKNNLFYEGDIIDLFAQFNILEVFVDKGGNYTSNTEKITSTSYMNNKENKILRYSYGENISFDKAIDIDSGNKVKLNHQGQNIIYFYYRFNDINNNVKTVTYPLELIVGESQLDSITATWKKGSKGGYPLGVTPDNSHPEYGSWTITRILKNAKKETIPAESCTYEFGDNYKLDNIFDNINKEVSIKVKYQLDGDTSFEYSEEKVKIIDPIQKGIVIRPKEKYKNKNLLFRDKSYDFSLYFDVYKQFENIKQEQIVSGDITFYTIYDKSELNNETEKRVNGFVYTTIGEYSYYYPVQFVTNIPELIIIDIKEGTYSNVSRIKYEKPFFLKEITPYFTSKGEVNFRYQLETEAIDDSLKLKLIPVDRIECSKDKLQLKDNQIIEYFELYRVYNNFKIKIEIEDYKIDVKPNAGTIEFTDTASGKKVTVNIDKGEQ